MEMEREAVFVLHPTYEVYKQFDLLSQACPASRSAWQTKKKRAITTNTLFPAKLAPAKRRSVMARRIAALLGTEY